MHWCEDGLVIEDDSGAACIEDPDTGPPASSGARFNSMTSTTRQPGPETTPQRQAGSRRTQRQADPLVRGLGKAARAETLPLSLTDA